MKRSAKARQRGKGRREEVGGETQGGRLIKATFK